MGTIWVRKASGVDVAVHSLGGRGPILLFAPANGFHGRCYEPVADHLADHFECWGVDLEGQGDTLLEQGGDPNMFTRMAADLLAVVDHFGREGCYVFGHSGGGLAAVLAEQWRPRTFRAMYLYEPVVFGQGKIQLHENTTAFVDEAKILAAHARHTPANLSDRALKRRRTFPSKAAALRSYATRQAFKSFHAAALSAYVIHGFREMPDGSVELKCTPETEARVFRDTWLISLTAFAQLRAVGCPVAVAAGTETADGAHMAPEAESPRIAVQLPLGRFEKYTDLGHLGPFQNPAYVAERVLFNIHFSNQPKQWQLLPKTEVLRPPRSRL